ncbi:mechanosensitive ion channel domain-containing protein [Haloparvum sp. PAK95]|uniref:mechanosensitive ion channel domain-containing protein n=1 Tax=Haloparvum sp. PAK95 TaxID=3418962 RepID=UPI003D2F0C29
MSGYTLQAEGTILQRVVSEFVGGIVAALPKLIYGIVFLTIAYLAISLLTTVLRSTLSRIYSKEEKLIVDLAVAVATLFLWFAAALVLLKIVGMEGVAASLGTATGFIALGVALALKEMLSDTVAGVYLLQDPDFNEGDFVTTASTTGTVVGIDLRKTRIRTEDGDLVVVANRDVEKRWTQEAPEEPETKDAEAEDAEAEDAEAEDADAADDEAPAGDEESESEE